MKRFALVIVFATLLFALTSCTGSAQHSGSQHETSESAQNIKQTLVTEELKSSDEVFDDTLHTNLKGSFEIQDERGVTYITVEDLKSAQAVDRGKNADGIRYCIMLTFTDEGSKKFEEATSKLQGEVLNVIVDGEVVCDPVVNSVISDGKAVIEGDFRQSDIMDILNKILK